MLKTLKSTYCNNVRVNFFMEDILMKNLKILVSILGISFLNPLFAGSESIIPKKLKQGDKYIKTEIVENDRIKFSNCLYEIENSCFPIGKQESYSIKELKKQKIIESIQIPALVATEILGVLAATYSSAAIAQVTGMAGTKLIFLARAGLWSGMTSAIWFPALSSQVDILNPVQQFRQAKAISNAVLNNEDVIVNNIDRYIDALEQILDK
jgi:hypothetical protein